MKQQLTNNECGGVLKTKLCTDHVMDTSLEERDKEAIPVFPKMYNPLHEKD